MSHLAPFVGDPLSPDHIDLDTITEIDPQNDLHARLMKAVEQAYVDVYTFNRDHKVSPLRTAPLLFKEDEEKGVYSIWFDASAGDLAYMVLLEYTAEDTRVLRPGKWLKRLEQLEREVQDAREMEAAEAERTRLEGLRAQFGTVADDRLFADLPTPPPQGTSAPVAVLPPTERPPEPKEDEKDEEDDEKKGGDDASERDSSEGESKNAEQKANP